MCVCTRHGNYDFINTGNAEQISRGPVSTRFLASTVVLLQSRSELIPSESKVCLFVNAFT